MNIRTLCFRSYDLIVEADEAELFRDVCRALGQLLEDLDYETDKTSGGAVAARVLAALITGADETAAKALQ